MIILHINKFFDLHGGAEVYMHDLMRHQTEAGHVVHALSTRSPSNLPSDDAVRFVRRNDLTHPDLSPDSGRKAMNYMWNREAKRATESAIRELKPDVIHIHNLYHHLSSSVLSPIYRSKIRCLQTLHDLKLACPNYRMYTKGDICERCKGGKYFQAVKNQCLSAGFLPNMLAALEMGFTKTRQAYERTVHTFICPSTFMKDKMIEWGEPASKMSVVHMPVQLKDPAARDGGYLLAVGRLAPDKGYEELIQVAAKIPSLQIKIAGAGPLESRLREVIQTTGAKVELLGFRQRADLDELYHHAEGFIASPVGYENAPLSVLRALGHGLPVIASRIGGLVEMVDDGVSGYLVQRKKPDAWHDALQKFLAQPPRARLQMAEASHHIATQRFPNWSRHVEMIQQLYESS